jgi:pilus assembly protein CpaE
MGDRILIVDDDTDISTLIANVLSQAGYEVTTAPSGVEALARVDQVHPDLIILDVMMPGIDGYETCRRLRRKPATLRVPIIMLTARDTPEAKIQGFEVGADQYVSKPFNPAELRARVHGLLQRSTVMTAETPKPAGKVIAVFSLRGGVGVSTLAVNLAAGLGQIWGAPTALIDMVLTAGHDGLMLSLSQKRTWAGLAEIAPEEIDARVIGEVMTPHASGIDVLIAPEHPEQGGLITTEKVTQVITTLSHHYQYVVLDLPHDFHDTTLTCLDAAQEILVLMAPELGSLLSMAAALEAFQAMDYPPDKIRLVLNRIFEPRIMVAENIEKALKRPVDLEIPFTPNSFIPAIGKGIPPILSAPNTYIGALLEDYAYSLSKEEHKRQRPPSPTKAWQRVSQRMQKRQATWSSSELAGGPAWLARLFKEISETA